MKDEIGDRFKAYEICFDFSLPRRLPLIIRIDGRGFHGLDLEKPFDGYFFSIMSAVAIALCKEVQGAVLAYHQSDEISIVARDDMQNTTQPWLGKRLSKITSLSAAIASSTFSDLYEEPRQFDARAFVVPDMDEAINYLIWRQQDATRNSVSMAARASFSHNECNNKKTPELREMLENLGKPWEQVLTHFKRGAITRQTKILKETPVVGMIERNEWQTDMQTPIFTEDRHYLENIYRGEPK